MYDKKDTTKEYKLKELIEELQNESDYFSFYYKYGCNDLTFDMLQAIIKYLNELVKTKEQLRKARKQAKRFKRKYIMLKMENKQNEYGKC